MTSSSPLDVVIVEAHHHCLERIHSILRKKKIFRPWSMLHFDAHPDLACPTVPAVACFTPRQPLGGEDGGGRESNSQDLYERLDSTASGIAEWILPLVLAAQLKTVEWIKPKWSKQLPRGHHPFQVGVVEPSRVKDDGNDDDGLKEKPGHFCDLSLQARLKVDWNHPYYLEDDSVASSDDLALAQTLNLHVTELPVKLRLPDAILQENKTSQPWSLDICLDYFACWNPYLTDIDSVDPGLTATFLRVMNESTCFQDKDSSFTTNNNPPLFDKTGSLSYCQRVESFRHVLREACSSTDDDTGIQTAAMEKLFPYYPSPQICETLIRTFQEQIQSHGDKALTPILEAIPFWDMPHAPLPTSHKDSLDESIARVEHALQQLLRNTTPPTAHSTSSSFPPPFLVTIARSTCDGFTPAAVVEEIQDRIVTMLHRIFCKDCKTNCALCITKDYGEWEGSTIG